MRVWGLGFRVGVWGLGFRDGRGSRTFLDMALLLDNFHRDNHTWCLRYLPEVHPKQPVNADLLAGKNTQACEQLNSGISQRTGSKFVGHVLGVGICIFFDFFVVVVGGRFVCFLHVE